MTPIVVLFLNHLWQSTLVGLIAWLACATWLRAHSPRLRYAVWMAASIKFLVPFAILTQLGRQFAPSALPLRPSDAQQVLDFVTIGRPAAAAAPFTRVAAPQAATAWEQWAIGVVLLMWAAGALLIVARWARQFWHLSRLTRDAESSGEYRGIAVLRSRRMHEERVEPGVVGIWRQRILIPLGIEATLTPPQLDAVLDHEWQHARRRDNLWGLVHTIVQGLFWFHPLVWLIGLRLMDERELACDESVLERASPDDYAEGILNVCKFYWYAAPGHATGITSADLKARMELIVRNESPKRLGRTGRWALTATAVAIVACPMLVGLLTAQALAPQANSFLGMATTVEKKFDVATVKVNASGSPEWRLGPPGRGQISIVNMSLADIITQSFRTSRPMVFGGPDWIRTTNFDIVGRGPDPTVGNPEVWEMMRALLIERFHLKYHIEQRELPVYVLKQAPGGHKLTLGENGFCAQAIKDGKACGDIMIPPFGVAVVNMPIGSLLNGLTRRAGRPVVDRTGLTGRYDVNVTFLPDGAKLDDLDLTNVPSELRPQEMGMFEALEKQAGLRLESAREPMPVLVIDDVSRPDEN